MRIVSNQAVGSAMGLPRLTNDVESQIRGVPFQAELLTSGGLLLHKLNEGLRLFHNDLHQTKEMLRLEARQDSLAQALPFLSLLRHLWSEPYHRTRVASVK